MLLLYVQNASLRLGRPGKIPREENRMFHTILVATGPSPWSRNTGETAIWLAAHLQGELVLTRMVEGDSAYQPQGPLVSAPQLRNALEATGPHILTPAAARATHA